VLIGLSVVMLVLSMVVTLMTQFVTSAMDSRGRHLLLGWLTCCIRLTLR
jgi:hypothetical protein